MARWEQKKEKTWKDRGEGETKDVHASQNYEVKLEIFALYHLVSKPDWHNIAHIATRHNRYV